MTSSASQRRLAYFAWIAVCLVWGTTYLGIRISLESIPPALMGGIRWTLAGGMLALYVIARGQPLPPPSRWGQLFLLGFLMLGLGNGGVVFAEQWVPSGLAAVIVATSPFWMAAVEAFMPDGERLRPRVDRRADRRLQRDRAAGVARPDAGFGEQPRVSRGRHRAVKSPHRLVDRLGVLEALRRRKRQ